MNLVLNEICIKSPSCYYFDDIIKSKDFDVDSALINEWSYANILIYDILYKTLIGAKPLEMRLDKIDGFLEIYDGSKYLVLLGL